MMENNDNTYVELFRDNYKEIEDRYDWLYTQMMKYLDSQELLDKVRISGDILNHVVIDYFVDIKRLKDFHKKIEYTNKSKIFSYTVFWILKHKPLQLMTDDIEEYVFINEKFAVELLRCFLFDDPSDVVILKEREDDIKDFLNTLMYYFKYRDYSAKAIEMMILAFNAGRGYQYSYDHRG